MGCYMCYHTRDSPKMNLKHLVGNWYFGKQRENVPPFAFWDATYVHHTVSVNTELRHINCVLQVIEQIKRMKVV